jgi:hypothetical protein
MTLFDEVERSTNKKWLIKGLIASGETSSWIGPPACGKSALMTCLSVHCARMVDWLGHRAKKKSGVLILALERADLYCRRLAVYRKRDQLSGLPIAVVSFVLDLLDPKCAAIMIEIVHEAERRLGQKVGLLIIDTYNKGIAAGGGDEDKAKDQNRVAANLRNVHQQIDVHIGLVGHTGKDETRGARGSNAHLGDVDVMVQISGDGPIKTAKVRKANDQPERDIATFQLVPFALGKDEDGDPIDVAIVEIASEPSGAIKKKHIKLTTFEQAGLRELNECVADCAEPPPNDEHVPPGSKGVSLIVWRERLRKRSVIPRAGDKNERSRFMRLKDGLRSKERIGIWDEYVWPTIPNAST